MLQCRWTQAPENIMLSEKKTAQSQKTVCWVILEYIWNWIYVKCLEWENIITKNGLVLSSKCSMSATHWTLYVTAMLPFKNTGK